MEYEFIFTFHIFFDDDTEGMVEVRFATKDKGPLRHSDVEQARDIAIKMGIEQGKVKVNHAMLLNCTQVIYDVEDSEDNEKSEE